MSKPWLLLIPAALLAPACTDDPDLGEDTSEVFSAPETFGVLAFLNGPSATFGVLDQDVGLDRRAAQNIVDHVRADKLDTYAELDAIAYVGQSALDKLLAYAHGHDLVPDYLVETVPFTGAEADQVLAAANGASQSELDTGAALDSRAAANIVAARPIADLDRLAAVSYVGATALRKLKTFAPGWHGGGSSCTALSLGGRAVADAQAWSTLLEEATWGDFGPFGRVYGLQATCADTASTAGKAALAAAINTQLRGAWSWAGDISASGLSPVAGAFDNLYGWTLDRLQDKIDSGSWSAEDATWLRRDEIHAALVGPSIAAPSSFLEMTLATEAEECSEHAAVLVDTRDGAILVVQIAPRC